MHQREILYLWCGVSAINGGYTNGYVMFGWRREQPYKWLGRFKSKGLIESMEKSAASNVFHVVQLEHFTGFRQDSPLRAFRLYQKELSI